MGTSVAQRAPRDEVAVLIVGLISATSPRDVEAAADRLAAAGDRRAIRPLLQRLGDQQVQGDVDVEDAVCSALVSLDVMCSPGNQIFHFLPRRMLHDDTVTVIRELGMAIPWRYFDTKHV